LNKSNAALDSQAQAAALSQEMHIREELKATLEREQLNFKHEKEALIMQVCKLTYVNMLQVNFLKCENKSYLR
jgi:hypothetical protein